MVWKSFFKRSKIVEILSLAVCLCAHVSQWCYCCHYAFSLFSFSVAAVCALIWMHAHITNDLRSTGTRQSCTNRMQKFHFEHQRCCCVCVCVQLIVDFPLCSANMLSIFSFFRRSLSLAVTVSIHRFVWILNVYIQIYFYFYFVWLWLLIFILRLNKYGWQNNDE